MPRFGYAFKNYDSSKHARASVREADISHKHAREIAHHIQGMQLERARNFLNRVISMKSAVPMRRFNKQVAHRSDPGVMAGRYPVKSAKEFVKLLDSVEDVATYKGMDVARLRIVSAVSHKGMTIKRFIPRARGMATPNNNVRTHVEITVQEI